MTFCNPNLLDNLHVATPCRADWERMAVRDESGAVRFCQSCGKNVYNISLMSHDEALVTIRAHEGNLCVRFARRADGTVVSGDCPVGVRTKRRRRGFTVAALLAALIPSPVSSLMKRASAATLRTVPALSALEKTGVGHKVFAWLDERDSSNMIIMGAPVGPLPPKSIPNAP
jgi:hypothetical protein